MSIDFKEKANHLPSTPGCYLMRKGEQIIYVGKAKNLKKRVLSYFTEGAKSTKTTHLVSQISDFDFIVTESEAEAFILENNLIKKHSPKYNIRLKDGKTYPYIEINFAHTYPRPQYVRRPKRGKKKRIYGPFPQSASLSAVLKFLIKVLKLRDCSDHEFQARKVPCLLYQMQQCSAPCCYVSENSDYPERLQMFHSFFEGKYQTLLSIVQLRMEEAARLEHFEQAAYLRDGILLLEQFLHDAKKSTVEMDESEFFDLVAFLPFENEVELSILIVRGGLLLGSKEMFFQTTNLEEVEEDLLSSLAIYYDKEQGEIPPKVIVDISEERRALLEQQLNVKVSATSNKYVRLKKLALENIKLHYEHRQKESAYVRPALLQLQEILNLKDLPHHIECVDIAIFQGKSPAASQVVFRDGVADKSSYRYYHLKELPEGNNDFAMLEEWLRRRVAHSPLPDLLVIDGGTPQVKRIESVMNELGLQIPFVGIAKERKENGTSERLVIPNRLNPYLLSKNRDLLKLMTLMRDEAHRFCRKLHHHAEKERVLKGG